MARDIKDLFAEAMGITEENKKILDMGSEHPLNCRCNTCLRWWIMVGPDPDTKKYGPFTNEEIESFQRRN
jgi:hypothetical protein